jgi:hypothetical protein
MSIFSLNYRGAGSASTVKEHCYFIIKFAPAVFCIVEIQINRSRVEGLASTLGYDHAFVVGSDGRSGGLGIFWNNSTTLDILGYSEYHIDASIEGNVETPWRLTCVYKEARAAERYRTWDMMKDIGSISDVPWVLTLLRGF